MSVGFDLHAIHRDYETFHNMLRQKCGWVTEIKGRMITFTVPEDKPLDDYICEATDVVSELDGLVVAVTQGPAEQP